MHLILKKGFEAISIQDIAEKAQTARITFYRHYRDKEELLSDCLNSLYEDLISKTKRVSAKGLLEGYSPISTLYEHIEEQEELYRILFSGHGTHAVIAQMHDTIAAHALSGIRSSKQTQMLNIPPEILANHIASAQIGLAIWWLRQNKPYPAAYMARISLWITLVGFLQTVGISEVIPPLPLNEQG